MYTDTVALERLPQSSKHISWGGDGEIKMGANSEYPATRALLKSTATMVHGPQSAGKVICMCQVEFKLKCYCSLQSHIW